MRAPCNCLYGSLVLAPLKGRLSVEFFPYHEFIVIATTGKLAIFRVPLQTANFLFVTHKFAKPLVGLSYVTVVDGPVP